MSNTANKKYISFSGGVESTTMCLLFGNKANAIFADTGFEHQVLYDRLALVEQAVRDFHGNDFTIIKVKREDCSLPEYIKQQKYYPSPIARFCTRMFKIEPIDKFLASQGECELMIGLNADEADQRTGNYGLNENVTYSYPLVDLNINREKCKQILSAANLLPNFPAYMQRGGCIGCFYKSKKEFAAMALLNEKEFDQVAQLEEAIQDKRGFFYSVRDTIPNLKDFKRLVQSTLFEASEMYPEVQLQTSCGVFCHR